MIFKNIVCLSVRGCKRVHFENFAGGPEFEVTPLVGADISNYHYKLQLW